jgi:thiamine-phosphate pyrophosphorylase
MLDPLALRLYVLTHADPAWERGHRDVAVAAIEGGATAIQLRAPELEDRELIPLAVQLRALCRAAGVLFIVNDRPEVAAQVGADGVHVGQRDDPAAARRRVHRDAVVGISVEDLAQAHAAAAAGADYLAVTVWSTATKSDAVPMGPAMLAGVAAASGLPVVGIGGIDATNAAAVLAAGAAGVAVISAVAAAPDPVAATAELRLAVDRYLVERAHR